MKQAIKRKDVSTVTAATKEDLDALRTILDLSNNFDLQLYTAASLMFHCGIRLTDAVNIKVEDIVYKENYVAFVVLTKDSRQLSYPAFNEFADDMREYIQEAIKRGQVYLFEAMSLVGRGNTGSNDRTASVLTRHFAKAKERGLNQSLTMYSFRVGFAKYMSQALSELSIEPWLLGDGHVDEIIFQGLKKRTHYYNEVAV